MKFDNPTQVMQYAINLAQKGLGYVEPNPAVGSVIVDDGLNLLGAGYHEKYGEAHAEINALRQAGDAARGATLYVTLEPCCHQGKTGPCAEAVIQAGISRVVIAQEDPAEWVAGKGIAQLKQAGIEVEVGLLGEEARQLNAPFIKQVTTKQPYLLAKWAMTWDGKLAARTGSSQWISGPESRSIVHQLRGCMDGVLVGAGTVAADDPLLTARPAGPRTATRIVIDSRASLSLDSQLVQTITQAPVLLCTSESAPAEKLKQLRDAGVDIWQGKLTEEGRLDWNEVLLELGRREMTNVLVEGGGAIFASLHEVSAIDEVHLFLAPKLVGGRDAITPLEGEGLPAIPQQADLRDIQIEITGDDIYLRGRLQRP
ncbi:Riboflavin biosynthesis protein RibD [Polystyrenella longa]|uniref:Riboflavin biosynthesis protein RibD n=1 Tax=Polystyrenella longa TaxID=2528007 RepID=A0A518CUI2_9PLAN|nr:bifunctional diaminohydroxyphosphoribosylaminopyrimidine deaminase/5-amino-6-(5-phosphoribosylamino)uracil reductase RibD [Polystyrenella longa]QDU82868.1 Riboflavin biosynthesis protein RibD [Polystyrenella longa]